MSVETSFASKTDNHLASSYQDPILNSVVTKPHDYLRKAKQDKKPISLNAGPNHDDDANYDGSNYSGYAHIQEHKFNEDLLKFEHGPSLLNVDTSPEFAIQRIRDLYVTGSASKQKDDTAFK